MPLFLSPPSLLHVPDRPSHSFAYKESPHLLTPFSHIYLYLVLRICVCTCIYFPIYSQDIPPALESMLRVRGDAEAISKMYRGVLPVPLEVDDSDGLRLNSLAVVDNGGDRCGGFEYLTDPVGQSSGAMLTYTGPIREAGSIVEVGVERLVNCDGNTRVSTPPPLQQQQQEQHQHQQANLSGVHHPLHEFLLFLRLELRCMTDGSVIITKATKAANCRAHRYHTALHHEVHQFTHLETHRYINSTQAATRCTVSLNVSFLLFLLGQCLF